MNKKVVALMGLSLTLLSVNPIGIWAAEATPQSAVTQEVKGDVQEVAVLPVSITFGENTFQMESMASYEALMAALRERVTSPGAELISMTLEPAAKVKEIKEAKEVLTVEQVLELLLHGGRQKSLYFVKEGESMEEIAQRYGMSPEDVKELNPKVNNPPEGGTAVYVYSEVPLVEVKTTERFAVEEAIAYSSQQQESDTLAKGSTRVLQAGANGVLTKSYLQRKHNGIIEESVVEGQEVTTAPVPEIVEVGTREQEDFIYPAEGRLSSPYGPRWGSFHRGIDIANPVGTPILAAKSGVITRSERAGSYGNWIEIDHQDGHITRYAHLSRRDVQVGDVVAQGDLIGLMGSTGRSTGPHLHFEIKENGQNIDPQIYLPY
ncbi:MAG: peptidoglycan DD-metalloendopeptidase family protein [Tissierellia bacterium]|nr:peptidoglycan DD-metalloendopeptidase family protein [Tissierellia bacterium]